MRRDPPSYHRTMEDDHIHHLDRMRRDLPSHHDHGIIHNNSQTHNGIWHSHHMYHQGSVHRDATIQGIEEEEGRCPNFQLWLHPLLP